MNTKSIDGKRYAKMLFGGAALLAAHTEELNDLNVFPVPDGDTGTNMVRTVEGGLSQISAEENVSVSDASRAFAHGTLLGARGNSGVILSQLFAGIDAVLAGRETLDAALLAEAFAAGTERAYRAVQHPTEGTILTVFREATEYASAQLTDSSTVEDFLGHYIEQARRSLEKTKELLPALAEADVVDSGGAGYLYLLLGMYQGLTGEGEVAYQAPVTAQAAVNLGSFTRDSVLEYGYCTEFLLRLTTAKVDPDAFAIDTVRSMLEEAGGESIVAYKEGDVVKVHVHTHTPGEILSRAQAYGEFLTVKIENMSVSHTSDAPATPVKKSNKKFSVLAVASGDGICALFTDAGADAIVAGGQSANPSTEEFLAAFRAVNAEHIIVLPNNKNVFLAANQAAELYDGAKVHIVPTESLMQGYAALAVITPGITDIDALVKSATGAAKGVLSGEVARAVRDATLGGKAIRKDDYMALLDGEVEAVAESANDAVLALLASVDADEYEIVTLFSGKSVSEEERATLVELLEERYPDFEITAYDGGQDVYDYMIAIE